MLNKKIYSISILIIFFILLLVALLQLADQQALFVPIFSLILFFILFSKNSKFLVTIYSAFLPITVIFPYHPFLGILNNKDILNIVIIILIIVKSHVIFPLKLNKTYRILTNIILILLIYNIYVLFKNFHFNIYIDTASNPWTITLRLIVRSFALIMLILKLSQFEKFINVGLIISMTLLMLSVIFQENLSYLGYTPKEHIQEINNISIIRPVGIFDGGDTNSLASYFVVTFGYFIVKFKSKQISTLLFLYAAFMTLVTILMLVSRTAVISYSFISLLLIFTSRIKAKFIYLILSIIALFLMYDYTKKNVLRFQLYEEQLDTESSGNRIGKWILYSEYFLDNPKTLLRGTEKEFLYNSHNSFIEILFHGGLFILLSVIILIYRLFMNSIRINKNYIYIFIPFISIAMTVGEIGVHYFFLLFTGLFLLSQNTLHQNLRNCIKEKVVSPANCADK